MPISGMVLGIPVLVVLYYVLYSFVLAVIACLCVALPLVVSIDLIVRGRG